MISGPATMSPLDRPGSDAPPPVRIGAVLLLAVVQFAAFVDRAAPVVVAGALKTDFALSDSQIGALQGPAFAFTYAAAMLVAGHWGRRIEAFRLIALCVAVWTAGGVAFALASNYEVLLAARMLLGIGQAAFAPAALMILGGAGVAVGRARAVSMFTAGSAIGRSGALFLGGGILLLAAGQAVMGLAPWRVAALALVAPNLVLILGLLWVARRKKLVPAEGTAHDRTAVQWLFGPGRAIFGLIAAGSGCVLAVQATAAWMPSIIARAFGFTGGEAALIAGLVVLVAAPAGHLSAGALMHLPAMRRRGPAWVLIAGMAGSAIAACGLIAADTLVTALACLAMLVASAGMASASVLIGLQPLAPDSVRGGVNAIFLAVVSVVGVGLGPWITGALSDLNFIPGSTLATSLAAVVIAAAVAVIPIAFWQGRRWNQGV